MSVRLVLICDVCGAVSDDHYAHPVNDARFRARHTGWAHRRKSSGGSKNKPGPDRRYVDLCPEHTYAMGLLTEPIRDKRLRSDKPTPEPLHPPTQDLHVYPELNIVYQSGEGPYRLYTRLAHAMRDHGADRGTLERLRRGMFASGADLLAVAQRWVTVKTETEEGYEQDNGGAGEPGQ
jgi:hypothetical protein